ncbi:MAG: M48 family metallopeptidase [Bacillota bacterium]
MKNTGRVLIGDKEVEYLIRYSVRAKNLKIRVGIDSGLEVVLPVGFKTNNLDAFLKSRESWIKANLDLFEGMQKKKKELGLKNARKALFLGQEYNIISIIKPGSDSKVRIFEDRLLVNVSDDSYESLQSALEKWYRVQARRIFTERVELINKELNYQINRIYIRSQKTRWGSCSRLGNISFNWRMVMAPMEVVDYLVAHELCHLKEMNHSGDFWKLVKRICPDYKDRRKWLKENGFLL